MTYTNAITVRLDDDTLDKLTEIMHDDYHTSNKSVVIRDIIQNYYTDRNIEMCKAETDLIQTADGKMTRAEYCATDENDIPF